MRGSSGQTPDDGFVDAMAVEIDDFDAPAIDDQYVAGSRGAPEVLQDEARKRFELRSRREAAAKLITRPLSRMCGVECCGSC